MLAEVPTRSTAAEVPHRKALAGDSTYCNHCGRPVGTEVPRGVGQKAWLHTEGPEGLRIHDTVAVVAVGSPDNNRPGPPAAQLSPVGNRGPGGGAQM